MSDVPYAAARAAVREVLRRSGFMQHAMDHHWFAPVGDGPHLTAEAHHLALCTAFPEATLRPVWNVREWGKGSPTPVEVLSVTYPSGVREATARASRWAEHLYLASGVPAGGGWVFQVTPRGGWTSAMAFARVLGRHGPNDVFDLAARIADLDPRMRDTVADTHYALGPVVAAEILRAHLLWDGAARRAGDRLRASDVP